MTKESRMLWSKIQKARKLELEKKELMQDVFGVLNNYDELEIDLGASNSNNIEETISCYVNYGEDEDRLAIFFCER